MKILVNTPNYKKPASGGVANHYYGLKNYWNEDVRYNIVGSRNKAGSGKYWLPFDILKFILKIVFFVPSLVVINPSLATNALKRDAIFLKIAKIFGRKVLVFFHGFNFYYAEEIDKTDFISRFGKADAFIVLSNKAKTYLREWGIKVPVELASTKVDDRLIADFDIENRIGVVNNILFLTRITKEKGIFIALDTFKLLSEKYPSLCYTIVGAGSELDEAKQYALDKQIPNIKFTGALTGDALVTQFKLGDLYLFTSFHEGMPTSVLEAMAFGLPVVTRPVGGLVDFFENGKMGEMVDSFETEDFVPMVEKYLNDKELTKQVSAYNHEYAKKHFLASRVALRLEEIFSNVIKG